MNDTQHGIPTEPVRVLNGHTSPETAYLVDDYPYGRRLRCQIRYWIETAAKGASKGKQRFVSQTTDPKRDYEHWNKPKCSTYASMAVLYLDHKEHVQWWGVGLDLSPEANARARLMGIYDQLTDLDRRRYEYLLTVSQTYVTPWHAWEERVHAMVCHMQETGEDPDVSNGVWKSGGRQYYVGNDPAVCIATARQRLQQS